MPPRRYYFRATDGSTLGPFNLNVVAEMIRADKVKANTPISLDGQDFRLMKSFPELATLLSVDIESEIPGGSSDMAADVDAPPIYSGDLIEVSLPKLLYHFIVAKMTGRLQVTNQSVKKELFLVNGKVVGAVSNLKRDQLGQHLLRKEVLSEQELEKIIAEVTHREERLGDYLIQHGLVTPHDLFQHLTEQLREKVYEVFNWRVGHYAFYEGQEFQGSLLPMNQNPWELVSEGVRQGYDLNELEELMSPYFDRVLLLKENSKVHVNQLGLMPLELKVFKAATAHRSFGDTLDQLGGEDKKNKQILATVYMGLELDLLTLGERFVPTELPGDAQAAEKWDQKLADAGDLMPDDLPDEFIQPAGITAVPPVSRMEQDLLETLNELKEQDFFQRLGLERTAMGKDVSRAFLTAARKYHPDQVPADLPESTRILFSDIFSLLNEAQQKLANDASRQEYMEALDSGLEDDKVDVSNILDAESAFQRGEVLLNAKKYKKAVTEFEEAVKLNPDEGEFHIYRGYSMFMSRPESDSVTRNQCIEFINNGLKMRDNEVAVGYYFLGIIYKTIGEKNQAKKWFKKALSIDHSLVDASRELRLMDMRTEKKGFFKRK
jgi:tetratricopeptide (TPR) repeat protein